MCDDCLADVDTLISQSLKCGVMPAGCEVDGEQIQCDLDPDHGGVWHWNEETGWRYRGEMA